MKIQFSFRPKIVDALKHYSVRDFSSDLPAGLTVGIVALPLSMALAIASGLPPQIGLFAAVIAGFCFSVFGGSRVQIGGPAGAFVPLLAPIVMKHGPEALVVCALMAGFILIVLGACKLGSLIRYIPFPVVTGFTSGIAIIIMSTQIRDFFGLHEKLPPDFIGKLQALVVDFHPHWSTVALGIICSLAIWYWPKRIGHRIPGSMAIVVLAAIASAVFNLPDKFGIQTLGTQFGEMPRTFPAPHWPSLTFDEWRSLVPAAMTVALLGAIESLLSAVVSDGMIDDRHDSNQELMGQGIANIAMGIFGGMPATGVIARTATNVRCGGRTPVAGIVHSLTVLVILLAAAPLAKHIPMAALSAVLIVVSLRMGEWHRFRRLKHWPKSDAAVFLCAFTLTVCIDLPTAVGTSLILASALLVARLSELTHIHADQDALTSDERAISQIPAGVMVFRIFGAFFFGAADKLETALRRAGELPDVLILRMGDVLTLDATGLDALEDLLEKLRIKKKDLILCRPRSQPLFALMRAGLIDRIGEMNILGNLDDAVARAREILAAKQR
jgi:SulP family sulfate permease